MQTSERAGFTTAETVVGGPPADAARMPAIPRAIGRYRIQEELGVGGMGVVLAAWDSQLFRRVAIKLLRPRVRAARDPSATTRLLREARALAALTHPNVVRVFEAGLVDDDDLVDRGGSSDSIVYIVMELVEGSTLREWMIGGPHPWPRVIEVFSQAGRGLAAAHAVGLVHRDFKPENVIIGEDGRVRVMDFGLARLTGATEGSSVDDELVPPSHSGPWSQRLTRTGFIMGTPAYMSPEQDAGDPIDARTDQFSFCVALFEALHGTRPFHGQSREELAGQRRRGEIELVSARGIPRRALAVVRRGLAPDPSARWPCMQDLLDALQPARVRRRWPVLAAVTLGLGGAAVAAILPPEASRCGRDALGSTEVLSSGVAAGIRAAFAATDRRYAASAADHVVSRLESWAGAWEGVRAEVCDDAGRVDGRLRCLSDQRAHVQATTELLQNADGRVVERALSVAAKIPDPRGCLDGDAVTESSANPAVAARARDLDRKLDQADTALAAGLHEQALALAQLVQDESRALSVPTLSARADLVAGSALAAFARFEPARADLERAFFAATRAQADAIAFDAAARLVSVVGTSLAQPDAAREWVRHAEAAWERLGRPPRPRADLLQNIGSIEVGLGRNAEALAALSEAREIYEALGSDVAGDRLARATQNLGTVEMAAGHLPQAEAAYREALRLYGDTLGREHPDVATSINNLGIVLMRQHRHEEGLPLLQEALEIRRVAYGEDHPEVAASLSNLGIAFHRLGREEEALEFLVPAVESFRRIHGDEHPSIASALYNEANARFALGDLPAALAGMQRARNMWERTLGPDHAMVANAIAAIAGIHRDRGEYDEALALHEEALAMRRRVLGDEHPDTVLSLGHLGAVHQFRGQHARALELFGQQLEASARAHGASSPELAYPLTAQGASLVDLHRPAEAIAPLERALALRESAPADPALSAETRFHLARALRASGRDRARARELAEQAVDGYERAGPGHADDLKRARAFLGA